MDREEEPKAIISSAHISGEIDPESLDILEKSITREFFKRSGADKDMAMTIGANYFLGHSFGEIQKDMSSHNILSKIREAIETFGDCAV